MKSRALVSRRQSQLTQARERSPVERVIVKPDPQWSVIAGVHVEKGDIAVAWLGIHRGVTHLFDSWVFSRTESVPFIVAGLKERGDFPVVFAKAHAEIARKMHDKGCRVLRSSTGDFEGYDGGDEDLASWVSREIDAGMHAGTFVVDSTNQDWLKEYDHFMERGGVVPQEGSPLMSATRYAYHFRKQARPEKPKFRKIVYDNRGVV